MDLRRLNVTRDSNYTFKLHWSHSVTKITNTANKHETIYQLLENNNTESKIIRKRTKIY